MKKVMYMAALAVGLIYTQSCTGVEDVPLDNTSLIPASYYFTGKSGSPFTLEETTVITYSDTSLQKVVELLSGYLREEKGWAVEVSARSSGSKPGSIHLQIQPGVKGLEALPMSIGLSAKDENPLDERYKLLIKGRNIEITATSPEGIYRGVSSLRQLINGRPKEGNACKIAPLEINDESKFAWKGMSFDVSCCFFEVDEVKGMIDLLALYKMNVLHWHLSDNQGWRIEIKKSPALTGAGAAIPNNGREGGYYTQEQYKEIVRYAADRFITVVPEINMPGHTAAVFASYSELKNTVKVKDIHFNIPGQSLVALDSADEKTMDFVEDVLTELTAMTPGAYLHISGDEIFGMPEDKFIAFIDRVRPMVRKLGKKITGWKETSRASVGGSDIIQQWIYLDNSRPMEDNEGLASTLPPEVIKLFMETFAEAPHDVERAIGKNVRIILSPQRFVYMSQRNKESAADLSQRAEQARQCLAAYLEVTVEELMQWDPMTFNPLIKEENIAGVECAIWCETIESFSDLQFLVLLKLPGIAEKAWSASGATDWGEYRICLGTQSPLWDKSGWNYFMLSLIDWESPIFPAQENQPLRLGSVGLSHGHLGEVIRHVNRGDFVIAGVWEENDSLRRKNGLRGKVGGDLFYADLREMLDKTKPEVVIVYKPIAHHLRVVDACAPRGIHVMVEKPLATTEADALRMAGQYRKCKIHLLTNYETTWYANLHETYRMISQSEIDGVAVIDFGCYGANLATWFLHGEKPVSVYAVLNKQKPRLYPKVDDDATIVVQYPNLTVQIMASWNWSINRKDMHIYGEKGYIYQDNATDLRIYVENKEAAQKSPTLKAPYNDSFFYLKAVVRNEIEVGPADLSSFENNLTVVSILDATVRSGKSGNVVKL
jgi:hexosaminidase